MRSDLAKKNWQDAVEEAVREASESLRQITGKDAPRFLREVKIKIPSWPAMPGAHPPPEIVNSLR